MKPVRAKLLRSARNVFLVFAILLAQLFPIANATKVFAAGAGNLDQWANKDIQWQNGNLGQSSSQYREGDSVPYRLRMTGVPTSGTNTVTIEWDIYKSSRHALDYITSYDRSTAPDPCAGVAGCSTPSTFPIPKDTLTVTSPVVQVDGNLTLYNGTITGATYNNPQTGDARSMTITFTSTSATPVLAWGGHIASQIDWGVGNSASAISGSPYHMRLIDLNGSGGNQDRSLSADAVSPTPDMTTTASASSIYLSQSVTDSVTVTGFSKLPVPAGTVTFYVCGPGTVNPDCSTGGTQVGLPVTLVNGLGTSSAYTPTQLGKYCFRAEYTPSADAPYSPQKHTNTTTECFTVNQGTSTVSLIKNIVSNYGGTASVNDFGLTIGGQAVTSGQVVTVNAGTTVALNEAGKSGYQFTSITGTGCPTQLNGTVTPGINQAITCTITNTAVQPKVKVIKHVVDNYNGGKTASNFTMNVSGTDVTLTPGNTGLASSQSFPGNESGTYVYLDAGNYTVNETELPGYTKTMSGDCSGTIALGEEKVCTITNTAQAPTVTIKKIAINDNGGTRLSGSFTLHFGNTSLTGASSVVDHSDNTKTTSTYTPSATAGTYVLSEDTVSGYTASPWNCTSGLGTDGITLTVKLGDNITCTITNNDNTPALTLMKNLVDTYNSGTSVTAWTLTATGPTTLSGTSGVTSGSSFDAGTYTLSETGPSAPGFINGTWSCTSGLSADGVTLTVNLGDNITCTVTNTAVQPKMTLVKQIDGSQYGDTATVDDFGLTVGGNPVKSGQKNGYNVGNYSLNEAGRAGYSFVSITGNAKCPTVLGGTVSLALGDDITCVIHNQAQAPTLTLKKVAVNDNGGTRLSGSFTLHAGSNNYSGGASVVDQADSTKTTSTYVTGLDVGSYALSEDAVSGYTATAWSCNKGLSNSTVTVALGESVTCTITNNDNTPALTLVKNLVDNYSSGYTVNSWTLTANGPTTLSGTSGVTSGVGFNAGNYSLSESGPTYGIEQGAWDCTSGYDNLSNTLAVTLGSSTTCTITNTTIQPVIKVYKHVVDSFGNGKVASDFDITVSGKDVTLTPGNTGTASQQTFKGNEDPTFVYMDAGAYKVSEQAYTGYTTTYTGDCDTTINVGDHKSCTVTNTAIQPKLTLVKEFDGTGNQADFTPVLNGQDTSWGAQTINTVGQYTITEKSAVSGYSLKSIACYNTGNVESRVDYPVNLGLGDDVTCVVTNEQLGSVKVVKFNDLNENGKRDEYFGQMEPLLPDFTMNLNRYDQEDTVSLATNTQGLADFGYQHSGSYGLYESAKNGWKVTAITCGVGEGQSYSVPQNFFEFTLNHGDNVTCEVGNASTIKTVQLVKSNNTNGNQVLPESNILYTVTVTNPAGNGILHNPTITDTPPTGFTYVSGSWTAVSSLRGDLKTAGIVPEPIYAPKGVWKLNGANASDDVLYPGETITFTYHMLIAKSTIPGTYINTVVAKACEPTQEVLTDRIAEVLPVQTSTDNCVTAQATSDVKVKGVTIVESGLTNTGDEAYIGLFIGTILITGALVIRRNYSVTGKK